MRYWPYLFMGTVFGFVLIRSEAASWYRIQEMFYLQSFHMYGILSSAVVTAFVGVQLMRLMSGRAALDGAPITIPKKAPGRFNYPLGGLLFGLGWGVIGLCPGPMFALASSGSVGVLLALGGALHGAWLYGFMRAWLPR
ncbi:MAG: YeeE/YedE family protein [Gammaproteobacteria bacterium]|nr:YeeE/YedE family protein [Gammaproteobacteria bacterium]